MVPRPDGDRTCHSELGYDARTALFGEPYRLRATAAGRAAGTEERGRLADTEAPFGKRLTQALISGRSESVGLVHSSADEQRLRQGELGFGQ